MDALELAADKRGAAMLSIGAGGYLADAVLKAGPARTLAYLSSAGADIAALEQAIGFDTRPPGLDD